MGMHIRLWKDNAHTQVFRDFTTGVIEEYGNFTGTIQTVTINDKVYYYANTAIFNGVNATAGTPIVSSTDNLGTSSNTKITIFWPDQSFNARVSGRQGVSGDPDRYCATFGEIKSTGDDICAATAGFSSTTDPCAVWAYTITLQGFADVKFVFITSDKIDGYIGASSGILVSANVFDTSLQTRFGRDKIDGDDDSGFGSGEGGDGDGTTDIPTENAMPIGGSGIHAYVISGATYNSISSKLWGQDENVFTALWYKFMNFRFNPIAGVINCIKLPSQFVPAGGSAEKIRLAGVVLDDTGAPLTTAGAQYVKLDYTITVKGYYEDYNDYNNSRCTLHLPFCGTIDLAPSAVFNRTLKVTYVCDVLTGNVSARVATSASGFHGGQRDGNNGGYLAQATGNCAYSVPICGNDNGMGDKLSTLKSFANGQIGAAASILSGGNPSTGDIMSGSTPALMTGMFLAKHTTSVVGSLGGGIGNIIDFSIRLTTERAAERKPLNFDTTVGFMSATGDKVGSYTGFTIFRSVNVSVASATDDEKAEIERLLKEGVYI